MKWANLRAHLLATLCRSCQHLGMRAARASGYAAGDPGAGKERRATRRRLNASYSG